MFWIKPNCVSDTSCGSFEGTDVQPCLRVHIFASEERDLPPLEKKGDFIYLFNVEVAEWQGIFDSGSRQLWHRYCWLYQSPNYVLGPHGKVLQATARVPHQTTWYVQKSRDGSSSTNDNKLLLNDNFGDVDQLSRLLSQWVQCSDKGDCNSRAAILPGIAGIYLSVYEAFL